MTGSDDEYWWYRWWQSIIDDTFIDIISVCCIMRKWWYSDIDIHYTACLWWPMTVLVNGNEMTQCVWPTTKSIDDSDDCNDIDC